MNLQVLLAEIYNIPNGHALPIMKILFKIREYTRYPFYAMVAFYTTWKH